MNESRLVPDNPSRNPLDALNALADAAVANPREDTLGDRIGRTVSTIRDSARNSVTSATSWLSSFSYMLNRTADAAQSIANAPDAANVALDAATQAARQARITGQEGQQAIREGRAAIKEAANTAKAGTVTANAWTKTAEKVGYAVSLATSVFVSYYGFKLDSEALANPKTVSSWQAPFAKVVIATGVVTTLGLISFGIYKLAKEYFKGTTSQPPSDGSQANTSQATAEQETRQKAAVDARMHRADTGSN